MSRFKFIVLAAALCFECFAAVVTVQWDPPLVSPLLVAQYKVYRVEKSTNIIVGTVPGNSYSCVVPAQSGTNAYFVKAFTEAGTESEASNIAYWVKIVPKVIGLKLNGILPNSTNRFTWGLAWSQPSTNVLAYSVVLNGPAGPFKTNKLSQTSIQFSGLTNGVTYSASIQTVDNQGDYSDPSNAFVKLSVETLDGVSVMRYTLLSEIR